jgi:hypothetical protein
MKEKIKVFVISFMFLSLFSCSNEEDYIDSSSHDPVTKSGNISGFDNYYPLSELENIKVNITLLNNGANKYLSTSRKDNRVDLYSLDDGSSRQEWYISKKITLCRMATIRLKL